MEALGCQNWSFPSFVEMLQTHFEMPLKPQNNNITKIDKFNYLNSLLEGTAALTVQGLSLTEANYDSAVELVKSRYGNPQQIITAHMDQLLKLPTCVGEKASSL